MTDLPTHPTRIEKTLIEGPVPAWVECDHAMCKDGYFADGPDEPCFVCNGEGGKWHEAVVIIEFDGSPWLEHTDIELTKYSNIQRRWEICPRCGNMNHKDSCPDCLNDKGESTGAEPGTAGPWEVVR